MLALFCSLLLLSLSGWQTWQAYQAARLDRQASLQHLVQTGLGLVQWAHRQQLAGHLSAAQAQQLALSQLRALRYGDGEYFWVNDMQPRVLMHPIKPELDGRPVGDVKDPEGNALFVRFVDTVRQQQAGFVRYLWPKPGHSEAVEKVSYVAGFQPWGWVLGTGVYMDDLRAAFWAQARWVLGAALAALLCLWLALQRVHAAIGRGLRQASQLARAIAQGDISQPALPTSGDEIGALVREMQQMSLGLNSTVGQVQRSALALARSSEEIAQANLDLSNRTEQAASSLQQASASLGDLTQLVQGNADAAAQASQQASQASAVAAAGGSTVQQAVQTMAGMQTSAQRIGDILGVIDGIAFQTNILALNAAVEAARAGESGRGFAVVAAEVRQLAQRSAQAAQEIKQLIQDVVQQSSAGSQQVGAAGHSVQGLVDVVAQVNQLIGGISLASRQQGEGLAQVNQGVQALDAMTQHNAALVEQSAAAADALRRQADALSSAVQYFKLRPAAVPEAAAAPHHLPA